MLIVEFLLHSIFFLECLEVFDTFIFLITPVLFMIDVDF